MEAAVITHYLRIEHGRRGSRTDREQEKQASEIFHAIHLDRVSTKRNYPVGLLSSRTCEESIGHGFAVYGTKEELEFLLTIKSMTGSAIARNGCSASDVLEVPADAPWSSFKRFRKDRYSRMGADRVRRRRLRSVEENKITATQEDHRRHVEFLRMKDATLPRFPFLRINSFSTTPRGSNEPRSMVMYIEERRAPGPVKGTFNSYGLSQDGASVPLVA